MINGIVKWHLYKEDYEPCSFEGDKYMASVSFWGCNFKCLYCFWHNLRYAQNQTSQTLEDIFAEIDGIERPIEALIVTGAEPTIQDDIYELVKGAKKRGLAVRIDTNGSNPDMLEKMLNENLVDFITLDVKAPKDKYNKIAGADVDLENIGKSIALTKTAPGYKFRTVVCAENKDDLKEILLWIDDTNHEIKNYWNKAENWIGKNNLTRLTDDEIESLAGECNTRVAPAMTPSGY